MTAPFDAPGAAPLPRDVLRVSGADALTWLQGQLSQDLQALAVATSTWTLLLQPQGKVAAWLRVTKTGADSLILDVDGGWGDAVRTRLERFKLRTKADVELVDWPCVAVRGPGAPYGPLPEGVLRLPLAGPPGYEGYDLLGPGAVAPDGTERVDAAALDAHRIVHGVPAMGRELDERTIPAEAGQWLVDASVSFTKGCYTGQELVARIDSRGGNVPRHLRVVTADAVLVAGTSLTVDGDEVGTVTSSADAPLHGPVALAYLKRSVAPGAAVDAGGTAAVVHEPPLARR